MTNILIYGTGSVAEKIYTMLDFKRVTVIAFINSNPETSSFHGKRIVAETEIHQLEWDYILIASGYVEPITQKLFSYNIPPSKIVSYIYDNAYTYTRIATHIENYMNKAYNRSLLLDWLRDDIHLPHFYPAVFWDEKNCVQTVYKDFVREQTVALLAKTISDKKILGDVAELGVYKGDFTIIIDMLFPEKKIYLYDTFDGFSECDVRSDATVLNRLGEQAKFKDTSVSYVLNRLKNTHIIIKKGYFPDTFDLVDERFCFISIDLNLEAPVYSALSLFYPLVTNGGYILISDYYAPFYSGTRTAVDRFCSEQNISFIPLADFYGSVLFCKQ